jgi:hypothetical protein
MIEQHELDNYEIAYGAFDALWYAGEVIPPIEERARAYQDYLQKERIIGE